MDHQLSRRDVLFRGGLAALGLGVSVHPGHAFALGRPIAGVTFQLDATSDCSCSACRGHAANKLFATRAAAAAGRAHPGCRCKVTKGTRIGAETWKSLFGSPLELQRTSVDLRDRSVRAMLPKRPGHRR